MRNLFEQGALQNYFATNGIKTPIIISFIFSKSKKKNRFSDMFSLKI